MPHSSPHRAPADAVRWVVWRRVGRHFNFQFSNFPISKFPRICRPDPIYPRFAADQDKFPVPRGIQTLLQFCGQLNRGENLKASFFYRTASVLLVLFSLGHTLGFRKIDPQWGVDSLLGSLRSIHFTAQGFDRTYWDFYVGFGLFVSVFLLFAAVLAWQLGSWAAEGVAQVRSTGWALAICFAFVTFLSWRFFFIAPVAFSMAITLCLVAGAWLSAKRI
jgi:hypothetical protein